MNVLPTVHGAKHAIIVEGELVAYVAAARYDHMIAEFLRTAQRLEQLRGSRADTPTEPAAFDDACEAAISIENQGWMARWVSDQNS